MLLQLTSNIYIRRSDLLTSLNWKKSFFKSDSPARQFETSQKKGGHNFCWTCPIKGQYAGKYTHAYNLTILSLKDSVYEIVKTPASLSKLNRNKTKLYDKMKNHEIVEEIRQRNVRFPSKLPAKDYKASLTLRYMVYNHYLPCSLDKVISISSISTQLLWNTDSEAPP